MEKVAEHTKKYPTENETLCPCDGVAYNQIPGYVSGYGCPVCQAIGVYHLPVSKKRHYVYYPKKDITAYELALIVPVLCARSSTVEVDILVDRLSLKAKRHFDEVKE